MTRTAGQVVVLDTSAAAAIILDELGIVIESRLGSDGMDAVARFLRDADIEVVRVDADAAERALSGWRRYGTGRHPAALDLGDCFAYALADRTGCPVVCVGDDFAATGIDVIRPAS